MAHFIVIFFKRSTSPPGGNQVDGLPPALSHIFDRFSKIVGNSNVLVSLSGSFGTVRAFGMTLKLSEATGSLGVTLVA